jgi:crotonobetainyl-CoA:carnitine CoA-transferase CaiB-like acyl-CoA transferase
VAGAFMVPQQPAHFSGVERGRSAASPALDQDRASILAMLERP